MCFSWRLGSWRLRVEGAASERKSLRCFGHLSLLLPSLAEKYFDERGIGCVTQTHCLFGASALAIPNCPLELALPLFQKLRCMEPHSSVQEEPAARVPYQT